MTEAHDRARRGRRGIHARERAGRADPAAPSAPSAVSAGGRACPSCGASVPPAATTCPRCGEPLVRAERKLVTVLFADLTGYTSLAARLDPEEVLAVVRPWMTDLRLVVEAHGGTVPQVMGDGFMAVFGVPVGHEDDAERAVLAGLALARTADELARRGGPVAFPGLHVGINSGEVVVAGSREPSGFALVGDAVNLTARLAGLASPGEVLVGSATRALARDSVRFARPRAVRPKGIDRQIQAYPAIGPRRIAPTGARPSTGLSGRAPFVDRATVLRRLVAAATDAERLGRTLVRAIVDEPGVGKTRLAAELAERLPSAVVLTGAYHPYGERLPLAALGDAIAAGLGVRAGSSPRLVRRAIRRTLATTGDGASAGLVSQLEALLGVAEASPVAPGSGAAVSSSIDAKGAVGAALRALSGGRLLVLVLDDLHWADPGLIELLREVRRAPWAEPVLILALGRPEPAAWHRGSPRVALGGLPAVDARHLLAGILGRPAPAALVDRLVQRADGNPLFLEESARMLVETGALARGPTGWRITDPAAIDAVPATLRLLVAARLDALPGDEKRTLQDAAIAGEVAWDDLLVRLAQERDRASERGEVLSAIDRLETRDLLRPRPESRVPGSRELESKHAVIRDVAYASLPLAVRSRLHRVAADWLDERMADRDPAAVAHHYLRAWELGPGRVGDGDPALARLAMDRVRRWGDAALVFQPRLAETIYARGLAIADAARDEAPPVLVAGLLVGRAESLSELGRHHEAIEAAEAAIVIAEASPAGASEPPDASVRRVRGYALLALARARSNLGQVAPARDLIGMALELFGGLGEAYGRARALHRLAEASRFDDFPTETRSYREAFRLYRSVGARADAASVAQDLAYLLTIVGGRDAVRWFERARRTVTRSGSERAEAALARGWAYASWYRGDLDAALLAAREARGPAAEAGDRWLEVDTILIEALVIAAAGPPETAERLVRQLLGIASSVGARHLAALSAMAGARSAQRAGRPDIARRRIARARRTLIELGATMELAEVDMAAAQVHLERGEWDEATNLATRAEAGARANGWHLVVVLGPLIRGRAALGAGRFGEARRELRRAFRLARALRAVGPEAMAGAATAQVDVLLDAPAGAVTELPARSTLGPLASVEPAATALETAGLEALRQGDPGAAVTAFRSAGRVWRGLGLTVWSARAELWAAHALDAAGRRSSASAATKRAGAILDALGAPRSTIARLDDLVRATPVARDSGPVAR